MTDMIDNIMAKKANSKPALKRRIAELENKVRELEEYEAELWQVLESIAWDRNTTLKVLLWHRAGIKLETPDKED